MKVYVVCEFPHGYEDDIHTIKVVTSDREIAEQEAQPDYKFFIEEHELSDRFGRRTRIATP